MPQNKKQTSRQRKGSSATRRQQQQAKQAQQASTRRQQQAALRHSRKMRRQQQQQQQPEKKTGGGDNNILVQYNKSIVDWRNLQKTLPPFARQLELQQASKSVKDEKDRYRARMLFEQMSTKIMSSKFLPEDYSSLVPHAFITYMTSKVLNDYKFFVKTSSDDSSIVQETHDTRAESKDNGKLVKVDYTFKTSWFSDNVVISKTSPENYTEVGKFNDYIPKIDESALIEFGDSKYSIQKSCWNANPLSKLLSDGTESVKWTKNRTAAEDDTYPMTLSPDLSSFSTVSKGKTLGVGKRTESENTKLCLIKLFSTPQKIILDILGKDLRDDSKTLVGDKTKGYMRAFELSDKVNAVKQMFELVVLFQFKAFLEFIQKQCFTKALELYNDKSKEVFQECVHDKLGGSNGSA